MKFATQQWRLHALDGLGRRSLELQSSGYVEVCQPGAVAIVQPGDRKTVRCTTTKCMSSMLNASERTVARTSSEQ